MDEERIFLWVIAVIVFSFVVSIILSLNGLHIETNRGEHTGYITAVEKTGLFFKTYRVYVKTDTESTQEDAYCVLDEKIYAELGELSKTKTLITVQSFDWVFKGIANCAGEAGGIIDGVEISK